MPSGRGDVGKIPRRERPGDFPGDSPVARTNALASPVYDARGDAEWCENQGAAGGRFLTSQLCAIDNAQRLLVTCSPEFVTVSIPDPRPSANQESAGRRFVTGPVLFGDPCCFLVTRETFSDSVARPAMACRDCDDASKTPSTRNNEDIEDLGEARGASSR